MANSSELDQAFKELEEDFGYAKEARREVIKNLRDQAAKVKVLEFDKSSMILAKMAIISTFDSILKSDSDLTLQKLKMKLARKDSETNGMVGQTIASMLKSIRVSDTLNAQAKVDPTEGAMDAIKQRAEELLKSGDKKTAKALTVTEGETTDCGGAGPTTSTPVAKLKPLKMETEEE